MQNEEEENNFESYREPISEPVAEETVEKPKYTCEVCGKAFDNENSLLMHRLRSHKLPTREEEGVPKPPEIETIEEAISFIKERLPNVYGIGRHDKVIIRALEDDPTPLRDGNLLHAFIKSLAPRAYDSHLSTMVIKPLYVRFPNLPQAIDKYLSGSQPQPPYVYLPSTQQTYGYPQYYPPPVHAPVYPFYPYPTYAPHHPYFAHPPKPPKTYKIVVDGQEIETDEAGFMAWQRFLKEREEYERRKQEHELNMKKLEAEIKKIMEETERKNEPAVPVKIGDKEVQVPAYLAPLYLKTDDETRKEIEKLREELYKKEVEVLKRDLEELKKRPSLFEELAMYEEIARRLGFHRSGRTTADLLDSIVERIDQRAAQLLEKIPAPGSVWKPEIKRTPEERARKAEEIKRRLEKSEEILQAEDELIKAAAKVKPRLVSGSHG